MVITVTRNLALDDLRRHRLEVSLDSWADEVGLPTDDLLVRITVQSTLGRLSLRDRQILWLFYYADLPIAEIARDLAISPNGVRLRLLRARQRFSQRWQEGEGHV